MATTPRESVKINARIPAEHHHAIQVMVQSTNTPFETFTDVLRHFIEEGIARIPDVDSDPKLAAAAKMVRMYRDIANLNAYEKAQNSALNLRSQLHQAEKSGDEKWIGETREAVRYFVEVIPYRTIAEKLGSEL